MKFFISKETLEDLYHIQHLTYQDIEQHLGLRRGRIYWWFKKYKIVARSAARTKPMSLEHRRHIQTSLKGIPLTEERKQKISAAHKGKRLSEAHKQKLRETFTGMRVGAKHPMWKGGQSKIRNRLRQSSLWKKWRRIVYQRDGFACVLCGVKGNGENLECHHIVTVAQIALDFQLKDFHAYKQCAFLWNPDNGITLCQKCHRSVTGREKEFEEQLRRIILCQQQ